MALADELIQAVVRGAGLTNVQARDAVASMLRFFAAQLPSPLFGELKARLNDDPAPGSGPVAGHDE